MGKDSNQNVEEAREAFLKIIKERLGKIVSLINFNRKWQWGSVSEAERGAKAAIFNEAEDY